MKKLFFHDRYFLWIFFILGCAGLFFSVRFGYLAYPEISIKLNTSLTQTQRLAVEFLESRGIDVQNYKRVTIFQNDNDAKNYLEKILGPQEAGVLLNDSVNAWNFTTRFFIPQEQEEFYVSYDQKGRLSGYFHEIPESREGARLTEEEAYQHSLAFLKDYSRFDDKKLVSVARSTKDFEQRRDYNFGWEVSSMKYGEGSYRIDITVAGDEVIHYREYLKIPEEWQRAQVREYSFNDIAQSVAEVFYLLFIIIPLYVVLFRKFRAYQLHYRFALNIAVIVFIVLIVSFINSIPLYIFGYDTLTSWAHFWGNILFSGMVGAIAEFLFTFLIILSGEALYREVFPQLFSLEHILKRQFFHEKKFHNALMVGFFGGLLVLAYQIVYYFFGRKVGYWVPAEIDYDNIFSTQFPWAFALLVGLVPAIQEEVYFRLFGISFFKKIFKKTWLGVIFTSVIWAFLHSAYPQQPFFARGIELTVVGIFFAFLFLRFGLLASVSAHYTLNAVLATQFLVKHNNWYTQLSSIAVSLLPIFLLLVAAVIRKFYKSQWGSQDLTNAHAHQNFRRSLKKSITLVRQALFEYKPLSQKAKMGLACMIILGVVGMVVSAFFYKERSIDIQPSSFLLSRHDALLLANEFLHEQGADFTRYHHVVTLESNFSQEWADYILETTGQKELYDIYDTILPSSLWNVRYFRPKEVEGYLIKITPQGEIYSHEHFLDENAPGEKLSDLEARSLAESYLTTRKGYDLSHYELVDSNSVDLVNRTNHVFVYKDNALHWNGGFLETVIAVSGDEVHSYDQYVRIPQDWMRAKDQQTLKDFFIFAFLSGVSIAVMIASFIQYLIFYRKKVLEYRNSRKLSFILLIVLVIIVINRLPLWYAHYSGIESPLFYHFQQVLIILLALFLFLSLSIFLLSFFYALWKENVSPTLIPQEKAIQKRWMKEGLYVGYGIMIFLIGAASFLGTFIIPFFNSFLWSYQDVTLPSPPNGLDHFFPAATLIAQNILISFSLVVAGILLLLLYRYCKRRWLVLLTLLIVFLPTIFLEDNYYKATYELTALIFVMGVVFVLYHWFFRKNIISVLVLVYTLLTLESGYLVWQENIFFKTQSVIVLCFVLLPIVLVLCFTFHHPKISIDSP